MDSSSSSSSWRPPGSRSSRASAISDHSSVVIGELQKENALLKKRKEELELILEEKELDIKQKLVEQELQGKRNELALRKKQVELEACKSLAEDANSIIDASDFNRVMGPYQNLQVSPKNTCTPTGMFDIMTKSQQHGPTPFAGTKVDDVSPHNQESHLQPEGPPVLSKEVDRIEASQTKTKWPAPSWDTKAAVASLADPYQYHLSSYGGYRKFIDEANGGLRFSGANASDYPAYRHRLMVHFTEYRMTNPDLLLQWIEATLEGQARRYIRNAFAVMDPGKACDVVKDALEEVYGREDMIIENALHLARRPARSIGHNRRNLLEFRADLRTLHGTLASLEKEATLKTPQFLGALYTSLSDKLRGKFETKYSPKKWSFEHFLEFLNEELDYINSMGIMKIGSFMEAEQPTFSRVERNRTPRKNLRTPRFATLEKKASSFESAANVCCLHLETGSHTLSNCRKFISMDVQQRWDIAKEHHLCFCCLSTGHGSRLCNLKGQCNQCNHLHHTLLHKAKPPMAMQSNSPSASGLSTSTTLRKLDKQNAETKRDTVGGVIASDHHPKENIALMVLTAPCYNENEGAQSCFKFFAAVDTGATHTLCSRELAKELYGEWKPDGKKEYKMFNGATVRYDTMMRKLELISTNSEITSLGMISFVDQELPFSQYLPEDVALPNRVDMILGSDLIWDYFLTPMLLNKTQSIPKNFDEALLGVFGKLWLSSGTGHGNAVNVVAASQPAILIERQEVGCMEYLANNPTSNDGVMDRQLVGGLILKKDQWHETKRKLEEDPLLCTPEDDELTMSITDEQVLAHYQANVREIRNDRGKNHLEFKLPWIGDTNEMPNNYDQAKSALWKLRRKLKSQPGMMEKYCEKIEKAISEGHMVLVSDETPNVAASSNPKYYIPHFHISQAKFRVVYDAAREYQGMCLNQLLARGPIFMQSIQSILIRFGERKFGIASDISNMFFQIRIHPDDQDMLRILWYNQPNMEGDVTIHKFQVAPYGLRCIPSMAGFSMQYTAQRNIPGVSDDVTQRVQQDMYVDDLITGVNDVTEGRRVVREISELLDSTGFRLTKWSSNGRDILSDVKQEDLAPAIRDIQDKEVGGMDSGVQHTLGLVWDTDTDCLNIKKPILTENKDGKVTKRQVVSTCHRFFDPLNWWAPLFVKMKLCCSQIVRQVASWDGIVPPDLTNRWMKILNELERVEDAALPRSRIPLHAFSGSRYEFHMFAESSKEVAAAVVYLRVCTDQDCSVSLVAAKTSILSQPEVKRQSIPRKELIALDIGARLLKQCLESTSLPIAEYKLWSDSQTVISWCSSKTLELRVFERDRVDSILKNSNGELPLYIATDHNPADIASRGCCLSQTKKWNFWLNGPTFLHGSKFTHDDVLKTCGSNVQCKADGMLNSVVTPCSNLTQGSPFTGFLSHTLDRTTRLDKPIRVFIAVHQCFQKWKSHLNSEQGASHDLDPHAASLYLVRLAQRECFEQIITRMQGGLVYEEAVKSLHNTRRERWMFALIKYVPFLDQLGILRMGGRLENCNELMDEQAHPAFLPRRHKVTELFVIDRHNRLAHRAAETVLASLQNDKGLLPIGGMATARHYLSNCFTCKLLRKDRACQLMASLPNYRVTPRRPVFTSISIDYAGPYEVKKGRGVEKRWLCLFVCNATSAIRIEVVESLETSAFLNALRRFLCLTGDKTRHIRCDCATTFIGERNVKKQEEQSILRRLGQEAAAEDWVRSRGITWNFSTPASSHHQGYVERQIRTFKEVSEAVLGPGYRKRTPSDFDLFTIFREAEYVMNCLPRSRFIGNEDAVQALRPIDLLTGYMTPVDEGVLALDSDHKDELRRGHKYTQKLASEWWKRWVSNFLPTLQKRQKWTKVDRNIQKGDFVLLVDETTPPRGRYPYAIVTETKQCPDGFVRSATVKTSDGLIRERDIRKLVLLEETSDSVIGFPIESDPQKSLTGYPLPSSQQDVLTGHSL